MQKHSQQPSQRRYSMKSKAVTMIGLMDRKLKSEILETDSSNPANPAIVLRLESCPYVGGLPPQRPNFIKSASAASSAKGAASLSPAHRAGKSSQRFPCPEREQFFSPASASNPKPPTNPPAGPPIPNRKSKFKNPKFLPPGPWSLIFVLKRSSRSSYI
jgi:hypothetical protein